MHGFECQRIFHVGPVGKLIGTWDTRILRKFDHLIITGSGAT